MDHCEKVRRKTDPRVKANVLSTLFFTYITPLFYTGFKKDLEEEQIFDVIRRCESKRCGDKMEAQWQKEKKRNPKSPSLVHLLWACFGVKYVLLGMIQLVWKLVQTLVEPLALSKVVSYFAPGQTRLSKHDAMVYAGVLIGLKLVHCMYFQNYLIYVQELAIQIRASFSSLIYRKSLKLSPVGTSGVNLGNVVTLLCKDVNTFEHALSLFNEFWIAIIETVVLSYLLYMKIGVSAFVGIGICLGCLPIQLYIGKRLSQLRLTINKTTDERLQITQETLSTIKIIKMYAWEPFFNDKVNEARKREMKTIMTVFYLKIVVFVIGSLSSKLGLFLLILVYAWLDNEITGETIFYLMKMFQLLRFCTGFIIPFGVGRVAEIYASLKRIKRILLAEELSELPSDVQEYLKPKVVLSNLIVDIKDRTILDNITAMITQGLTIVTGSLGSGKSSLLKAILKDYPATKGRVETLGTTSYASQEPWLFPSSIRQNILFGEPWDEARYRQVIDCCALEYDFNLLEKGDDTIVSDRGLNLSKGQQARINLARAVYKKSDIYLFDDSLTALDSRVQDWIFDKAIKGFLKDKIVVLVTHNPKQLGEADNILLLGKGSLRFFGQQSELSQSDVGHLLSDSVDNHEHHNQAEDKEEETSKLLHPMSEEPKKRVYKEIKQVGSVTLGIYSRYVKFGGGFLWLGLIFFLFFIAQFIDSSGSKLLSKWVNYQENATSIGKINGTNTTEYLAAQSQSSLTLNIYSGMIIAASVLELLKNYVMLDFLRKASVNIHKSMIGTMVRAVMAFFDTYFIGNILNRFSQDLNIIDEEFPFTIMIVIKEIFDVIGMVILIASVQWQFAVPSVIFVALLVVLRYVYIPTARSLKRLEAATRSPLVGHLNSSMEGVTTVRASNSQSILRDEFDHHQNLMTATNYTSFGTKRAFGFYLDFFSILYFTFITMWFMLVDTFSKSGDVGLAIQQASDLAHKVQHGIMMWSVLENLMTSVERVVEYTHVPTENPGGSSARPSWPEKGCITFSEVSLTYSNTNEKILKDLSFAVAPQEKIGIVGRTGAGKSSIISTLFRLYQFEGRVTIDEVDIKTLTLDCLRKNIAIIPQDPVLFSGTIRTNMDPLNIFTDEEIWDAFDRTNIKSDILSLDQEVKEQGSDFSSGQRQLICLARALVRKNKIVVLDEATANMDPETDSLIQKTIKDNFVHCTVLIIAHRLYSVMDCNKVMVMDKGRIVEFDDPKTLLCNPSGVFYSMVKQSGLL